MSLADRYEYMLIPVLDHLISRYQRDPEYHFIDTKINILTGEDFGENDPWYMQKGIVYPWIQCRALEALAGHYNWLDSSQVLAPSSIRKFKEALLKMMREIVDNMEQFRARNHGRLFFLMKTDGTLLKMDENANPVPLDQVPGEANFSDLFYSKGLWAAAAVLDDKKLMKTAEKYFKQVVKAILDETFITDQQMFDPKNPVLAVPGKLLEGTKMIALGGTALGLKYGDRKYWEGRAVALIRRIFDRYVHTGEDTDTFRKFDFWEAVDTDGNPWIENGKLICDPGHTLEFVGLSLKNIPEFQTPAGIALAEDLRKIYADFLRHQFGHGFAPGPGGIIQAYDLIARQPVNTDMPWWSLPETVRAAALAVRFTGDTSLAEIIRKCSDAFLGGYVREDRHSMAVQTRNAAGEVVPVIPATPDMDPGYHTNLSIIDALPVIRELKL